MIISVEKAKALIDFNRWSDEKIEMKLKAIEQTIRAYTNNNFQDRDYRRTADIVGGLFMVEALTPFDIGDTVQISESRLNKGLFTVASTEDSTFTVEETVKDEKIKFKIKSKIFSNEYYRLYYGSYRLGT